MEGLDGVACEESRVRFGEYIGGSILRQRSAPAWNVYMTHFLRTEDVAESIESGIKYRAIEVFKGSMLLPSLSISDPFSTSSIDYSKHVKKVQLDGTEQ